MAISDPADTHGHTIGDALAQERRLTLDNDDGTTLVVTGESDTEVLTTDDDHNLNVGDSIVFSALTGGAGLVVGHKYYVVSTPSATTFTVSATRGGVAVNFTTDVTAGTIQAEFVLAQTAAEVNAQITNAAG